MPKSQRSARTRVIPAGLTAAAFVAALLVAPQAAYAATTVGPPIVAPGGSATINDPNITFNTTSTSVLLSVSTCPSKYALAGGNGPWYGTVNTRSTNSINFTVPSAGGPPAGINGTVKQYFVCAYDGIVQNTSDLRASAQLYVGTPPVTSVISGVTGGGNQLTVTAPPNSPLFTGLTSVAAVFTTGSCNATLGTTNPSNLVATNVVRQSNTSVSLTVPPGVVAGPGGAPTMYSLCLYDGSSGTGPLLSFASYGATVAAVTPSSGSYLATTGVTMTSPTPFLSGITTLAALLVAGGAGCPGTYSTAPIGTINPVPVTGSASVRKLSNNRAAVSIPPLPLMNSQPTPYQVCLYAGTTAVAPLVGSGVYTASVIASPAAVTPAAGPAAGGNTVTVIGTDFPTDPGRITATLGGAQLMNIQPISDKAFTAQVPAHAVEENVALVMTTPAGTKALPGAYSFRNPIKVSPNTAPSTAPTVDVSIQGMGFMSINFGSTGNAGRVFMVNGVYNGADAGGGIRANGPVAECVSVLPISDEELVCTLQLNRRLNATGTGFFDPAGYTNTLTTDVSTVAGSRIITSTAGKFNANDVGQPIVQSTNTNIPAASIVTSVLSPQKAVISAPALVTSTSAFTAVIGNNTPVRTFSNALSTTAGSTTLSLAPGAFTRDDVGRIVTGATGIPGGTTITAVAPGGASATLSAPATASTAGTLANVSITDGSTTLTGTAIAATDANSVIGANSLGIPPGTTITAVTPGTSATLSAAAVGGGTAASLPVNRPVSGNLYAAAPVPDGSYNLVVVSNGAPDAAATDPDYFQTNVTSSSAFTVSSF